MPSGRAAGLIILSWFLLACPRTGLAQAVDLALVLAIDCSYSVDGAEYDLQVDGLASAFRDPEIIAAIGAGPNRRIGVTLVQWSNNQTQVTVLPWRILAGASSAQAFASDIARTPRMVSGGGTSISGMMSYGYQQLAGKPFAAHRMAIDIVADGRNNNGADPRPTRDLLSALGITINGLTILNEVRTLDSYFKQNVIGGPANFVIKANAYEQFKEAIHHKLLREIKGLGIATNSGGEGKLREEASWPARS